MLQTSSSSGPSAWLVRLLTFLLAGLAAASVAFWVMHWPSTSTPILSATATSGPSVIDSDKVAQLLGANLSTDTDQAPTASPSTSYKLLGVIAQGGPGKQGVQGSALIAIEGAVASPYRVGEVVDDGLVLLSVKARSVELGRSGQSSGSVTLALPLLPGMADTP